MATNHVGEAICIEDWHIEAENGDRQDCFRGKTYTISRPEDGKDTVMVFSRFWVPAPKGIFAGWISLEEKVARSSTRSKAR